MEKGQDKSNSEHQDVKSQSNSSQSNAKETPFFNFLKFFRMKHKDWSTAKVANTGAKIWSEMSSKEKEKYKEVVPVQSKTSSKQTVGNSKKTRSRSKSRTRKIKHKGKPRKRAATKAVRKGIRSRPATAKSVKRGGKGGKSSLMVKSSAEASIMRMLESIKKMRKDLTGKGKNSRRKRFYKR